MRLRLALLGGLALLPAPAAAQQREAWQPPFLTTTRYDEDCSGLADPANRTGHWTEAFKYIPLSDDGHVWLSTGTEVRLRSEKYDDNLWGGADAPDDGYIWARALPYADLHVGEVRAFVQPIVAYAVGVSPGPSPVDQTRVDLLQGFVDAKLPLGEETTVRLRAGRAMVGLGTERLVGTRYGPNVPLAFDGGRATLTRGRSTIDMFWLRPVDSRPGSFDDRTSHDRQLWGAYASRQLGSAAGTGVDLYYLGYRNRAASFDQGAGREVRHTIGLRSFGTAADWRWNIEAIYQFGRFAGEPIRAWSVATELSRRFADAPLAPNVTVRVNAVSGDRNPDDGKLQTFNALFPKGKYFGELSPVGPYNIVNGHFGATADVAKGVTIGLSTMAYWRQSTGDGIYDIPGHLIRSGRGSDARFIGKQAEATVSWTVMPELELSASLSAFVPGAFIRETGSARTIHMLGFEANFRI